jgi:hypothetical protein
MQVTSVDVSSHQVKTPVKFGQSSTYASKEDSAKGVTNKQNDIAGSMTKLCRAEL